MKKGDLVRVVPLDDRDPLANALIGDTVEFQRIIHHSIMPIAIVRHLGSNESLTVRVSDLKAIHDSEAKAN